MEKQILRRLRMTRCAQHGRLIVILYEVRNLTCGNNRSFAGAHDDKMHKLGAAGGSETQRRFHKPAGRVYR
jgi:hypothetical protein